MFNDDKGAGPVFATQAKNYSDFALILKKKEKERNGEAQIHPTSWEIIPKLEV